MTLTPGDSPAQISGVASPFDAIRRTDQDGEFWSARDLMAPLGYGADWRNFEAAIARAKITATNTGQDPTSLFGGVTENSGGRPRSDYRLTRYAAYLIAMNGDPRKTEIARAQEYFATKTRQAETGLAAVPDMSTPEGQLAVLDMVRAQVEARIAADRRALEERAGRELAETKVAELEPAAHRWDTLVDTAGDYLVGDVAKILQNDYGIKTGPQRLWGELARLGWVYRSTERSRWRAKQTAIDTGRLRERLVTREDFNTGERVGAAPQVRVTHKGINDLHKALTVGGQLVALPGGAA